MEFDVHVRRGAGKVITYVRLKHRMRMRGLMFRRDGDGERCHCTPDFHGVRTDDMRPPPDHDDLLRFHRQDGICSVVVDGHIGYVRDRDIRKTVPPAAVRRSLAVILLRPSRKSQQIVLEDVPVGVDGIVMKHCDGDRDGDTDDDDTDNH